MRRVGSLPDTQQLYSRDPFSKISRLHAPTEEDSEVLGDTGGGVPGKLLAALLIPFVPVYAYALYHLMDGLFLAAYLLVVLVYFVVVGAFVAAEISIRPPWYRQSTPAKGLVKHGLPDYWQGIVTDPFQEFGYAFEEVEFTNNDGMTLRGWFVPGLGDKRNLGVVFCHGGGRDRRAWLRHLPIFHTQGMPCLLFDLREHGISDGAMRGFTYGVKEQHDVLAAVRYMRTGRNVDRVLLCGTSVGGASVVYAAARDPEGLVGVICENPVAHVEKFISEHMEQVLRRVSPRWFWPACEFFVATSTLIFLWRIGLLWDRKTGAAAHAVRSLTVPIFVMHGTADEIVPLKHGQEMYDNAPAHLRYLWIGQGAWHCALYDRWPEEFRRKINEFLVRIKAQPPAAADDGPQ